MTDSGFAGSELQPEDGAWFGLTKDEAVLRCKDLGLACRFTETRAPAKGRAKRDGEPVQGPSPDEEGILKVIRARRDQEGLVFLLSSFAPGKEAGCRA